MDDIVVGIDGSDNAQDALIWAWREARVRGAALKIVTSVDSAWFRSPSTVDSAYEESSAALGRRQQKLLDDAVAFVRSDPRASETSITTVHENGQVVPTLLRLAGESSMLVVGRRGLGRLGRLVMGSVSAGLARESQIPVTVVPAEWLPTTASDRDDDDDGLIDPGPVVVGMDGSEPSLAALRHGIDCARRTGARLKVVACWQLATIGPMLISNGWAPPIEDYEQHMQEMVDAALAKVAHLLGDFDSDRVIRVIEHALPTAGLLMHSATAQRLVVGHRGHGGFDRLLLGSVSSQLLEHADCPVTVVRV